MTFQVTAASPAWSAGDIYEFGFEDGTKGALTSAAGGAGDGTVISTDGALGTHSLTCHRTASTAGDDTPGPAYSDHYTLPAARRDVWVRFALKSTPVWSGGIQKLLRVKDNIGGLGGGTFDGNGTLNDGRFSWYWDDLASGGGTNLDGVQNAPYPAVPLQSALQDQWHWWEFHLQYPAGQAAHVEIYYDNTKVLDQYSPVVNSGAYYVGDVQLGGTVNALPSGGPITFDTRFDQIGVSSVQMHIPARSSIA